MASLSNSGGLLTFERIVDWREGQRCEVAVKDVPLRVEGQVVEESIYVLHVRVISIRTRLSDAELATLKAIFDASDKGVLTGHSNWTYFVWLRNKRETYEYSESGGVVRPWLTTIELDCEYFVYTP